MKLVNTEAEIQALLTILTSKNKEIKTSLLSKLNESFFAFPANAEIYNWISQIASKKGIIASSDILLIDDSVSDEAKTIASSTDVQILRDVDDIIPLVDILIESRQKRAAFGLARGLTSQLKKEEGSSIEEITGLIEQGLLDIRNEDSDRTIIFHSGSENNLDETVEAVLNAENSDALIPSGFENYDKHTKGFRRGNLLVVASHFKGGKSMAKLSMLLNQYRKHNLKTCNIILEMQENEEMERLLSCISGVEYEKVYKKSCSPEEKAAILQAWEQHKSHGEYNDCRFSIYPATYLTISQLELLIKPYKYDVVAIDYINLLSPEGGMGKVQVDAQMLGTFYKQLKILANRLNCLIIALTQMDIATGDIRYAKAAKEDANVVWVWHFGEAEQTSHIIKVKQLAARSHAPFPFYLREDFAHASVTDYDGEVASDGESTSDEE